MARKEVTETEDTVEENDPEALEDAFEGLESYEN